LDSLVPLLLPNIEGDPGDIAARSRQARDNAELDRIGEEADNRNCGCCRLEVEGEECAHANNHIRFAAHDVLSQIRKMRGMSFAGKSLN
jgi:hypothetical protein